MTASKRDRQHAILELIATREIGSQEDLRQLLAKRGWEVTQSTLSRDLRDLRIARVPTGQGVRYVVASSGGEELPARRSRRSCPQLFVRLEGVSHMIVLKTVSAAHRPSPTPSIARSSTDILGTIAGDDTILMICRSEGARERVARRLASLGKRST